MEIGSVMFFFVFFLLGTALYAVMKKLRIVVLFPSSVFHPGWSACLSKQGSYQPVYFFSFLDPFILIGGHYLGKEGLYRIKVSSRKPLASNANCRTRQQFSTQLSETKMARVSS